MNADRREDLCSPRDAEAQRVEGSITGMPVCELRALCLTLLFPVPSSSCQTPRPCVSARDPIFLSRICVYPWTDGVRRDWANGNSPLRVAVPRDPPVVLPFASVGSFVGFVTFVVSRVGRAVCGAHPTADAFLCGRRDLCG